jgi:hypothetical protein
MPPRGLEPAPAHPFDGEEPVAEARHTEEGSDRSVHGSVRPPRLRPRAAAVVLGRALVKWAREGADRVFLAVSAVVLAVLAVHDLWLRLKYEAQGPATPDTAIYAAVGRGIVNHVPLYTGLFETKPPIIFLLFALSWKTVGSWALVTDLQVAVILAVFVTPALLVLRERGSVQDLPGKLALALLGGASLALYTAMRSGEIQVESFGAAALLPWVWVCYRHPDRPPPLTWGRFLLGSASVALATMTKEPLVLAAIAVGLINARTRRDYAEFAAMLGCAGLLTVVALWVTGTLHAYLYIYLPQMLVHTSFSDKPLNTESVLVRAVDWTHVRDDLWKYSPGLCAALAAASVSAMAREGSDGRSALSITIRWGLALTVVAFAIGLSGLFYDHQHVPLVPLAIAILVTWLVSDKTPSGGAVAFSSAAAVLGLAGAVVAHEKFDLDKGIKEHKDRIAAAETAATQIDRALDCTGETRYAYLGSNGVQPWGWTKHSPLGPFFLQYFGWFAASEPRHREQLLDTLKHARLLVFQHMSAGDFNDALGKAVDARFHPGLPPKCASITLQGDWSFRWADK